jgi:hypothetical protein
MKKIYSLLSAGLLTTSTWAEKKIEKDCREKDCRKKILFTIPEENEKGDSAPSSKGEAYYRWDNHAIKIFKNMIDFYNNPRNKQSDMKIKAPKDIPLKGPTVYHVLNALNTEIMTQRKLGVNLQDILCYKGIMNLFHKLKYDKKPYYSSHHAFFKKFFDKNSSYTKAMDQENEAPVSLKETFTHNPSVMQDKSFNEDFLQNTNKDEGELQFTPLNFFR